MHTPSTIKVVAEEETGELQVVVLVSSIVVAVFGVTAVLKETEAALV